MTHLKVIQKKIEDFLFNQLFPYLEDDDIADDTFKLSQILQVVDNNKQIRQCDLKIANLDPIKDANDIKTLNSIKNITCRK